MTISPGLESATSDATVRQDTCGYRTEEWLGALAVLLVTALFLSLWWNRYLSPTFGGELFASVSTTFGMLPYRDYYASSPPGSLWLTQGLTALGGNRLIIFWAFGALVRVAGALGLYFWLCRLARPVFSAFATATTFIFASGDIADFPFFYNHMSVNCCVLAGWAAAAACDGRVSGRRFLLALASGFLLGYASTIKQTSGLVTLLLIQGTSLLLLWGRRDKKGIALVSGGIALGALALLGCVALWLATSGLLGTFIEQTFTVGPSSKGGLLRSLVRPLYLTSRLDTLSSAAIKAIALIALGVVGYFSSRKRNPEPVQRWYWLATILVVVAMVIGSCINRIPPPDSREPTLVLCYVSLVGCLLAFATWVGNLLVLRRAVDTNHALLAALGFGCAYALSMSWPAFEIMILPGLSYLLAATLQHVAGRLLGVCYRVSAIAGCLLIVITVTWRKHVIPQGWGRWSEPPIASSTVEPRLPELAGFRLSPTTAEFFENVTATIVAHSRPTDAIFVYPNMPIFYGLARRRPATRGLSHWVDTCPDFLAEADAQRLLAQPPMVIVIRPDLPRELSIEEALFRGGRPSKIRVLLTTIQTLLPRYQLVATYPASGHPVPVMIYSLKRGASSE